jgi:hypothetical protein
MVWGKSIALYSFLFFLFFSSIFYSQSAIKPMFDFGSMQEGKLISGEPGEEVALNLYFFVDKEYGNRITHILLNPDKVPEGWQISFDPPAKEITLNISGILTKSTENIYVEPAEVLAQIPDVPKEGIFYIKSPSGKGYLQAKRVQVKVKIPPNAQFGQTYSFKVVGIAFWFGEEGNVALKQSRPFDFQVKVVKKVYTEEIIGESQEIEKKAENKTTTQAQGQAAGFDFNIILIAGVIILIVVFFLFFRKPKSNKSSKPTKSKKRK